MNFIPLVLLSVTLVAANVLVYQVFIKYFLGGSNAAMKFLVLNMTKDVVWMVIALVVLPKEKSVFFILVGVFLFASFFLYYHVIRRLNNL